MYARKINFKDYDGNDCEEVFYFNLNKAEVMDWLVTAGGYTLDKVMEKLTREHNGKEIMNVFKDLIYRSYGVRDVDSRRFIKSKEVKDAFMETEAYSELFYELVTDAEKAAAFVNAIIPAELASEVEKLMNENPDALPEEIKAHLPAGSAALSTVPAN